MRSDFVEKVLNKLFKSELLSTRSQILVICGGSSEKALFKKMGFSSVVISNLDERMKPGQFAPFEWSFQDAHELTFDNNSYDWVLVSDGLHHCSLPHKALSEMYRVAKVGIIVFESRDSFIMRFANKLGLSPEYELEAVIDHDFKYGGLNNTHIPNFIYRWTERDFQKTLQSFDPTGRITFQFEYGLSLPYGAAGFKKTNLKFIVLKIASPLLKVFTLLFKRQCNLFSMIALKPTIPEELWPWLSVENEEIVFNKSYAHEHFKVNQSQEVSA